MKSGIIGSTNNVEFCKSQPFFGFVHRLHNVYKPFDHRSTFYLDLSGVMDSTIHTRFITTFPMSLSQRVD